MKRTRIYYWSPSLPPCNRGKRHKWKQSEPLDKSFSRCEHCKSLRVKMGPTERMYFLKQDEEA